MAKTELMKFRASKEEVEAYERALKIGEFENMSAMLRKAARKFAAELGACPA